MFKVNFSNTEIKVVFIKAYSVINLEQDEIEYPYREYIDKDEISKFAESQNIKLLIDTKCEIYVDGELEAEGYTTQNPLDQYNKWLGKKLSLARALNDLIGTDIIFRYDIDTTEKSFRYIIWNKFFETFPKAKI